jgi:nitroreductase
METLEAIFTRRSVRDFVPQPIDAELLDKVLQAAVAAPSGGNLQAWGFVLVQSDCRIAALRSLAPGIIGRPAAVIAICLDSRRVIGLGSNAGDYLIYMDAGTALENMLLTAHSLGFGACPVGSFHKQAVAAFLDLPVGVSTLLLLALGYPRIKPNSPVRRPLKEVVFREKWGVYGSG